MGNTIDQSFAEAEALTCHIGRLPVVRLVSNCVCCPVGHHRVPSESANSTCWCSDGLQLMQQFRGVLVVSKPLLSLASYCTECTAARVLHTRIAGSVAHPASSLVADCQQPLWELLRSSTQLVAIQHRQPTSHSQSHCSHPHARSFASQSAHRLQQTLKRAKRAAQAHQGSKAATSPPHEDPASNSAVDSIPQSEAGVEASQERPTTLQVCLTAVAVHLNLQL